MGGDRFELTISIKKMYLYIAACAIVAAAVLFLAFVTFQPQWIVLYNNRSFTEVSAVSNALDEAGIRHRVSSCHSRLYVRNRNRHEAHAVVLRTIDTAHNFPMEDAIDLHNIGTMEEERAAILLHIAQRDIEAVLVGFEGIAEAFVHLSTGDDYLLRPQNPAPAMGVLITTTRAFSLEEGQRMAALLRTMVLGLEIENISIVDQHLNPLFLGGHGI